MNPNIDCELPAILLPLLPANTWQNEGDSDDEVSLPEEL